MSDRITLNAFRQISELHASRVEISTTEDGQTLQKASGFGKNAQNLAVRKSFAEALKRNFGGAAVKLTGFNENSTKRLSSSDIRKILSKLDNLDKKSIYLANRATIANSLTQTLKNPDSAFRKNKLSFATAQDFFNQAIKKHPELSNSLICKNDPQVMAAVSSIVNEVLEKTSQAPQTQRGVEFLSENKDFYNVEDRANARKSERFGPKIDTSATASKQEVGIFEFKKVKAKGVEPGFDGTLRFLPSHARQMRENGTFLNTKAKEYTKQLAQDLTNPGNSPIENNLKAEIRSYLADKLEGDTSPQSVQEFLDDPQNLEELENHLLENSAFEKGIQDHLKATLPMFTIIHHVKMDYAESDRTLTGRVQIPKSKAKNSAHRTFTAKSRETANKAAIKETLASDLMSAMGIHAQKARLVPAKYQDGSLKLMISSEHMTGNPGENFEDFAGKLSSTRNAVLYTTNSSGQKISDSAVEGWGRNKILMLLLADRDAIGTRGDNKGRLGNTFAAIDPGHSLEGYMSMRNIHDDFSFDQPRASKGMQFKNFTIFDDSTFKEKMAGVENIEKMRDEGSDMRIFDGYRAYFAEQMQATDDPKLKKEYASYITDLEDKRSAFIARRDYILDEVFKERLEIYHENPDLLESMDKMEKLLSPSTLKAPDGSDVKMRHLRLEDQSKRVEVHAQKEGDGFTLSFKGDNRRLERLNAYLATQGQTLTQNAQLQNGQITLHLQAEDLENFNRAFDEERLKSFLGV